MKPLAERLHDLALRLESEKDVDDVRLAANVLEARDTGAVQLHPLKGVPTIAEERLAWDRYAAGFIAFVDKETDANYAGIAHDGAAFADRLLEERRKRFGAGK